jgi:hypothetical protein
MPMMVTGGFRTREGMQAALASGDCDVVGLGRPLCCEADFPRRLLAGEVDEVPRYEDRLRLSESGLFSPTSPLTLFKVLNTFGAQSWFYCQLFRMADGKEPDLGRGILSTLREYLGDELATARRMHRAFGD